jgi:hypothetical protein
MKKLLAILVGAIITTAEKGYRGGGRGQEKYCIYSNSNSNSNRRSYSNSAYFNCNCN